jgi:hypothetical protein
MQAPFPVNADCQLLRIPVPLRREEKRHQYRIVRCRQHLKPHTSARLLLQNATSTPKIQQVIIQLPHDCSTMKQMATIMDVSREQETPMPDPTPHWTTGSPYEALQNTEIRLLRVLPIVEYSAPIKCILSTHNLSAAPPFKALSYTWGVPHRDIHKLRKSPSSATRQVDCNDLPTQIGENLYDFLLHCACDVSGSLKGHLWVKSHMYEQLVKHTLTSYIYVRRLMRYR